MCVCVSYMLICACTHECTVAKRFFQLFPKDSFNLPQRIP